MKRINVDFEQRKLILSMDFLEAESLGYDTIRREDVYGIFYKTIIQMISEHTVDVFGTNFEFGIKTYVDMERGMFYYEVMPYDERLDEVIMEEMLKSSYSIKYRFPYGLT